MELVHELMRRKLQQQRLHNHRLSELARHRNFEVWANHPSHSANTQGCTSELAPKLQGWSHWTLAKSSKSFHEENWFCPPGKLRKECLGAIVPGVHYTPVNIEPLLCSLQKRKLRIASCETLLITKLLQSSRNCWRWVLASSLALSQKWLACTIMIKPVLISKFSHPVLTSGPIGTLLAEGEEKFWRVF